MSKLGNVVGGQSGFGIGIIGEMGLALVEGEEKAGPPLDIASPIADEGRDLAGNENGGPPLGADSLGGDGRRAD